MEWTKGPKLIDLADTVEEAIRLHEREFGDNHGLDRIFRFSADLDTVEDLLKCFGVQVELPNPGNLDDFEVLYQSAFENPIKGVVIPSALLVGHINTPIYWRDSTDGRHIKEGLIELHPLIIFAVSKRAEEEFCSKLLSAADLVPYRHGEALPEDADHDGLYNIEFGEDSGHIIRDA